MIGPGGSTVFHTPEGGIAFQFINKTGSASVKGTPVQAGTTLFNSINIVPSDDPDPIGVIYNSGIADGDLVWVVCFGKAQILLENGTASTFGNWARISATVAGRIDATLAGPPGGTIIEIDNHFREIGHCLESVTAGTDKLALCLIHFN